MFRVGVIALSLGFIGNLAMAESSLFQCDPESLIIAEDIRRCPSAKNGCTDTAVFKNGGDHNRFYLQVDVGSVSERELALYQPGYIKEAPYPDLKLESKCVEGLDVRTGKHAASCTTFKPPLPKGYKKDGYESLTPGADILSRVFYFQFPTDKLELLPKGWALKYQATNTTYGRVVSVQGYCKAVPHFDCTSTSITKQDMERLDDPNLHYCYEQAHQ